MRGSRRPIRVAGVVVLALGLHVGPGAALGPADLLAQTGRAPVDRGRLLFTEHGCHGCHTVGKMGTPIATDLSRIGARYRPAELEAWLSDPSRQRPTAHMPRIELTPAEVKALAAYLASLR